jgi:hypothetical protein
VRSSTSRLPFSQRSKSSWWTEGDLLAPAHHGSVKADEHGRVAERSRERLPVSGAPGIQRRLVQSADLALVVRSMIYAVG